MQLHSETFLPKSGTLSGHLFENAKAGMEQKLYWNLSFDFEPFTFFEPDEEEGYDEEPILLLDWLVFSPNEAVFSQELATSSKHNSHAEASIYFMGTHIEIKTWNIALLPKADTHSWILNYDCEADFWVLENPQRVRMSGLTEIEFGGYHIVKDNFAPNVTTAMEAKQLLARHISIATDLKCEDKGFKFVIG